MVFLNDKSGISGFTLIEVLVSMMVMAISLTIIMGLFSGGLNAKKRANDYKTAVELANNKIVEVLLEQNLEPGIQTGMFNNDYSWSIEIIPDDQDTSDSTIKIEQDFRPYIIKLEVKWKHGEKEKIYSISTVKMEKK